MREKGEIAHFKRPNLKNKKRKEKKEAPFYDAIESDSRMAARGGGQLRNWFLFLPGEMPA